MPRRTRPAALTVAVLAVTMTLVTAAGDDRSPAGSPTAAYGSAPARAAQPVARVAAAGSAPRRRALPSRARVHSARRFARHRPGRVAFAVATPGGKVRGRNLTMTFRSASISKALMAVTLLRRKGPLPAHLKADAYLAVHVSDNAAAHRLRPALGDAAIRRTARLLGMRDYAINGSWAESTVSARDFARFFAAYPKLLTPRRRAIALGWFQGVVPYQAWGLPRALRGRGWKVGFKGGWRGGIVHQAARVRRGSRTLGVAVLTDHEPSMAAGILTIEGIARRLLNG